MTVVADEVGVHDTLGGRALEGVQHPALRAAHRAQHRLSEQENFLAGGSRHGGLGTRDMASNINALVHERPGRHAEPRRGRWASWTGYPRPVSGSPCAPRSTPWCWCRTARRSTTPATPFDPAGRMIAHRPGRDERMSNHKVLDRQPRRDRGPAWSAPPVRWARPTVAVFLRRRPWRPARHNWPTKAGCASGPLHPHGQLPAPPTRSRPAAHPRPGRPSCTPDTDSFPRTPISPDAVQAAGIAFAGPHPAQLRRSSAPAPRPRRGRAAGVHDLRRLRSARRRERRRRRVREHVIGHAGPVRLGWRRLGRLMHPRLDGGDEPLLPGEALKLPDAEPEQDGKARQHQPAPAPAANAAPRRACSRITLAGSPDSRRPVSRRPSCARLEYCNAISVAFSGRSRPSVEISTSGVHNSAWTQNGGDQVSSTHKARPTTSEPAARMMNTTGPSPESSKL